MMRQGCISTRDVADFFERVGVISIDNDYLKFCLIVRMYTQGCIFSCLIMTRLNFIKKGML